MKISVITPTAGRPQMLRRAIKMFLAQNYVDKEMIVVGDEEQLEILNNDGLINEQVRFVPGEGTIGAKRNLGCEAATGEVIVHCDDDDLYAADWLTQSVHQLAATGADCVGLRACYFFQPPGKLLLYQYTGRQGYAVGATLCYWKKTWLRNPFPDIMTGEDTMFASKAGIIANHEYIKGFCGVLHGGNTCSHKAVSIMKEARGEGMKKWAKLNC